MSERLWIGEAQAAFDQSLEQLGGEFGSPDFWIARAQTAATIALAREQHTANLIAWKQLQTSRSAARDQGVGIPALGSGDAIADEIERALGIEDAPVEPGGDL